MGKKSTRGKIRDRTDYSELLESIKANKEAVIEQKAPKEADNNLQNENCKAFLRMLSNEKTLYFISSDNDTIHEKHCELLKGENVENLIPLSEYKATKKQCPKCALRAYLRMGAEDYKKHKNYAKLFGMMHANIKLIRKIFLELNFKTNLAEANTIRIQNNGESWKIKALNPNTGKISLSHNDYRLNYDGTRKKYGTYHIQNEYCKSTNLQNAIYVISNYKTHRALSAYTPREQQIIKILKSNPKETQTNIANTLGASYSTVRRTFRSLKESETLKRIGGKKHGFWKITM